MRNYIYFENFDIFILFNVAYSVIISRKVIANSFCNDWSRFFPIMGDI